MGNKIKKILSMVLIGIMVGAIPAGASHPIILPGPGSDDWDGNGADSVRTCASGETPFLHWIFTQDGYTLSDVTLTIVVNGVASIPVPMVEHAGGSWTYDSGYYDPSTLGGTHVDFKVVTSGGGNIVLTISDGCTGTPIPEFPTVALPIAAVIGLLFFFQQRNSKKE